MADFHHNSSLQWRRVDDVQVFVRSFGRSLPTIAVGRDTTARDSRSKRTCVRYHARGVGGSGAAGGNEEEEAEEEVMQGAGRQTGWLAVAGCAYLFSPVRHRFGHCSKIGHGKGHRRVVWSSSMFLHVLIAPSRVFYFSDCGNGRFSESSLRTTFTVTLSLSWLASLSPSFPLDCFWGEDIN